MFKRFFDKINKFKSKSIIKKVIKYLFHAKKIQNKNKIKGLFLMK